MKRSRILVPAVLLTLGSAFSGTLMAQQDKAEGASASRMMADEGDQKRQQGGMNMMQMMQNCPCMRMMKDGMMNMPGMDGMPGMQGMNDRRNGTSGTMGAQGLSRKAGDLMVRLQTTPSPPRAGRTRFTTTLKTASGVPVTGATVTLKLSMPSMNMGGPTATLRHQGKGIYTGTADLSMAGDWRADVAVRQPRKAVASTHFSFNSR